MDIASYAVKSNLAAKMANAVFKAGTKKAGSTSGKVKSLSPKEYKVQKEVSK